MGARQLLAESATCAPMTRHERVALYLEALAKVCLEVAAEPRLLPTFLRLVALVPRP
jgi:hypothetical protein